MPVTGNLYSFIEQQAQRGLPPLSFLQERYTDIEQWRVQVADYLQSLLLYRPEAVDLSPELADVTEYPDYLQQKWYITSSAGERMPVLLLLNITVWLGFTSAAARLPMATFAGGTW